MNCSTGNTCVQAPEPLLKRKTIATSRPLLIALCLSAACLLAQPVFGQTSDVWLGGAGLWSSTSMWSTGQLPTSSNKVFIDNGKAGASLVTINFGGAQCGNLTIDSDDSVTIVDGASLYVSGPTISNTGTLSISATSGNPIVDIAGNVTLVGSGGLTMSNNAGNTLMGYGQASGATFTNQTTIHGSGNIGGNGLGSGNSLINQGTVNANQTTPLTIAVGAGTFTNTGTLEATNGATLALNGSGTVTNTGGFIHADTSSAVQLESGFSITGGTLTTSGSGTIQANCCFNDGALNGVTINGTFQVNGSNIEYLSGTISDNSSIQLNSSGGGSAILDMQGAVTLKGTGTLTLSNNANNAIMGYGQSSPGASLTNQITIRGAGDIGGNGVPTGNSFINQATVNANLPTPLTIAIGAGTITNTGILEATNGATLSLNGGGTLTNSGGAIHAGSGSVVSLASGVTISGGTLTTGGTGTIQANCCFNDGTLDGVINNGIFQLNNSNIEYLSGTFINNGTFQLNSVLPGSSAILDIKGSVTLKGSGKVVMSNANINAIMGYGQAGGATLINQSTIQGAGSIGPGSSSTFTNQHIVTANQTTPLIINGNFSNAGTLNVYTGSAMNITGGLFTNFTGGNTLTGGKYMVSGTLGFDGANIGVNSANITLNGRAAQIVNDLNGAKALAHLYRNTSVGSISLQSGKILYIGGKFTNLGKITVGAGSGFQLGALPLGGYIQTAGSTTVDGALSAPNGMNIQAGTLLGKGAIATALQSSGSVTAGDSALNPGKLSVNGSYTQTSTGVLNIAIGGLTAGTQYGQVSVTNGVSLNGTLNLTLINGFLPSIGDAFVIMTGSAISGTFATVNGLGINSGEHFAIAYNPANVTLTVVTGP